MDVEFLSGSKNFKNRKIKYRHLDEIEPHEALLDRLAQKKEEEMSMTGKKFEVPLARKSLDLFYVLFLVLIVFLFAKTFQLQVIKGKDYLAQAQENKFIVLQIQAERGVIYDKNMNQLVYNEPSFDLVLDKANLPGDEAQKTKVLKEVSRIINEDFEILKNKAETGESPILKNIPQEILIVLETKIKDLPGFKISQNWVRQYQDGEYFSQAMGYMGKVTAQELKDGSDYSVSDWLGKDGLEKTYENVLKKNSGKLQIEQDALAQEISRQVIEEPSSGNSLVLWLDSDLQKKITEVLGEVMKNTGSNKSAAVALDPKTGGVLSLISLPSFDNNLFNKGSDQEALYDLINDPQESLYNLAIGGQFPSGSTIKPFVALGALQESIISTDKKINCQGKITVPNENDPSIIYNYEDLHIHGLTDIRKAIAESCNVFFYTIGGGYGDQEGLGPTKIKKYLEMFGWGQKTGIDLPGEAKGFIPSPAWKESSKGEKWWDGDTYHMAIGQGDVLVTPLQMAISYVPIANGGKLFQPQMVQKIVDSKKNTIEEFLSQVVREDFIDSENLQVVREGMRHAVTGQNSPQASAISLNSLPVAAAAKTGTAETGKKDVFNNWITIFAPYDDPQIVLTIVFKDVQGLRGATVPAAKDILQWYFTQGEGAAE
ncbi:MAG: penicillin-binding protein 2 [Patescibacteria group bacterium]